MQRPTPSGPPSPSSIGEACRPRVPTRSPQGQPPGHTPDRTPPTPQAPGPPPNPDQLHNRQPTNDPAGGHPTPPHPARHTRMRRRNQEPSPAGIARCRDRLRATTSPRPRQRHSGEPPMNTNHPPTPRRSTAAPLPGGREPGEPAPSTQPPGLGCPATLRVTGTGTATPGRTPPEATTPRPRDNPLRPHTTGQAATPPTTRGWVFGARRVVRAAGCVARAPHRHVCVSWT